MTFRSVDPSTGETIRTYEDHPEPEIERRLGAAAEAFADWRRTSFRERGEILRSLAAGLRAGKVAHADLMASEMGKPLAQGEAEVEKSAWVCEFYADHAESFLYPEPISTDARESFVRFDPLGPVLAIMPWNFPFWQVLRFAAPALAAGNVALLKHAPGVPGCALALETGFADAGFPEGAFQNLFVSEERTAGVIADDRVAAVTLTGSGRAGSRVAELAGHAIKKVVLELGGSDPFVVLENADVPAAVEAAVTSRTLNGGQSCIAAKRFVLHESVREDFEEEIVARFEKLVVGDPRAEGTDVGPIARADLRDALHEQVERSVKEGAVLRTGGRPLDRAGFFYAPTVLTGVRPEMTVAREETFGPVAAILTFETEDEAVELANATRYGLGASLWTRDVERGKRLAARIDAGAVFVNDFVKSDPRLPFGGVKESGHGRELSREGIREFVNVKTVSVG